MTIAKDIAAKFAVAIVAVAMALSAFAPAASAQTTEELQQMINDLLAQIAQLQSSTGQTGGSVAAGVCPYTWTRDLSQGSTGGDVMKLQQFLNADPDTRVAAEGVGSAGMETEYYGPATAAAVSKMQVKYRAEILSPANLVNPTGYFGPSSRAKANSLCVAAPVVDDSSDDMMDDEDEMDDEDDDNGPVSLGGEASLGSFEIDDAADDEIEEGAEDVEIAEVTVEFENGDAEISRLDLVLVGSGDEQDPWDVFESISLWVDGDKIAEENADDEDDYLDEDDGSLRFSGLDLVAMEDEEVEITVAATLQGNLDGVDNGEAWTVGFTSMRFFDADGVATTDTTTGDLDPTSPATASFTIEEEGSEDEVIVKTSSNDPDGTTLKVEDDSDSDWYTIFVFDLDTDDSVNDIEFNEISVTVDTASSTGAAGAFTYADAIDDIELVVDGVTIDDLVVAGGTATTAAAGYDASRVLRFDVDGDVVVDAGDRVEAELRVKFNSLALADEGSTVRARVSSLNAEAIDAEGADDIPTARLSGAATGDVHTLRSEGLVLEIVEIDAEKEAAAFSGDIDTGTYTFEFEVTAFDADFYMDEDFAIVDFDVLVDGVAAPAASSTATLDIAGADDAAVADKVITDGETATFTLTVETNAGVSGAVEVVINSVAYSAADDATEELSVDAIPADDWTSDALILN